MPDRWGNPTLQDAYVAQLLRENAGLKIDIERERRSGSERATELQKGFIALMKVFPEQFAAYTIEDDPYMVTQTLSKYDVAQLVLDLKDEAAFVEKVEGDAARRQRLFGEKE